ncbi:MAG: flagellar hook-basal body complex protein FliE [Planctomycetota bacterium]|jgi:flagellar hook-basal body complex protein FliE
MSGFDVIGPGFGEKLPAIRESVSKEIAADELAGGEDVDGFLGHLTDALEGVQGLSDEVKGKAEALSRGEPVELHDLMISMGKSEVAFNLMVEVRNKLLEAWQTLSRAV